MLADAKDLGDTGATGEDGKFDPAWTEAFKQEIDGIILVRLLPKAPISRVLTS